MGTNQIPLENDWRLENSLDLSHATRRLVIKRLLINRKEVFYVSVPFIDLIA